MASWRHSSSWRTTMKKIAVLVDIEMRVVDAVILQLKRGS